MNALHWPNEAGQAPRPAGLTIEKRTFTTSDEVRAWLLSCGGRGPLCTVDSVTLFAGELTAGAIPLHADLILAERVSAMLRFDRVWSLWIYTEGVGDDCLCVDETRIDIAGGGKSTWRVYWRREEDGIEGVRTWRPHAACLIETGRN